MKRWIALYYDIVDVNKFVVADDDLGFSGIDRLFLEKYGKRSNGCRALLYSHGNARYATMIERIADIIDEEVSMIELINLIRQYAGIKGCVVPYVYNEFFDDIESITEAYYPKSKRNKDIEHMDNVFMKPEDDFDNETGKWEYDFVPEKMSYSDLIGFYEDFCSNYIDAFNTEDEHWTFIYENGEIVNQDGDNGKMYVGEDRWSRRLEKRNEKKLSKEERFRPISRRGLVAIIWSNGEEERYWYKNEYGKELLVEYTGWSFEQLGDEWL